MNWIREIDESGESPWLLSLEDRPTGPTGKAPLQALFQRPWFNRIWVLQEISLTKEVIAVCGDQGVDWKPPSRSRGFFVHSRLTTLSSRTSFSRQLRYFIAITVVVIHSKSPSSMMGRQSRAGRHLQRLSKGSPLATKFSRNVCHFRESNLKLLTMVQRAFVYIMAPMKLWPVLSQIGRKLSLSTLI